MSHSDTPVRVRIAPSPTGDPHVGTAYIGQINALFARSQGGKFILRIEDTDQTRSKPVYEAQIIDSLRWFGLTWDEGPDVGGPVGPYRQSERQHIYAEYTEILLKRGSAYRCFATAEELDQMRTEQKARGETPRYDRRYRDLSEAEIQALLDSGRPYVIRLAMPLDGETIVHDRLRGEIAFQNDLIDDQVLIKSDGMPTYHFANVVDDHLMGISHVIRAEEWITSTPKHIALYQAFGWDPPEFIHMPLLRNADRSKISKRKNPTSIFYYRQAGFLPQTLRNFLGLMGWAHPSGEEKFTVEEMAAAFNIDDMSLGAPVFDLKKLRWLNGLYIRELEQSALKAQLLETLFGSDYIDGIMPLVHERMETLEDFWTVADFFFVGEVDPPLVKLIPKKRTATETRKALAGLMDRMEAESAEGGWTAEVLEGAIRAHCEAIGWKTKELFMAVRLTVTGKTATPGLPESMAVLGKERVRRRFQVIQEALKGYAPEA